MRQEIDSAKWTGQTGVRGVTVIHHGPRLYMAFHWRIFCTAIQQRKAGHPFSIALAGWPLGTLEITLF